MTWLGRYGDAMRDTTTVRITRQTHEAIRRLASQHNATIADIVARAVRLLRQDQMGIDLSRDLADDDTEWLDGDLG
jgi:hypothetical protein